MKTANFDLMTNETAKIEVDRSLSGDALMPNMLGTVTIVCPTDMLKCRRADCETTRISSRETTGVIRDHAARGGRDGWAKAEAARGIAVRDRPAALRDETGRKG